MTIEQITAMIQALGFPICVSIALFFAIAKVGKLYKESSEALVREIRDNAAEKAKILSESVAAGIRAQNENSKQMKDNTDAVIEQTAWWRKVGSDPMNICQAKIEFEKLGKNKEAVV